ncbi:uncharacterized protein UV8b_02794 [Ustilaginoidea virens]|uniref:Uncharacterized protein n=1 Tax=Ustilaginoidea virens TaxID=1159556 RepID=A0A8E5HNH9_USTVR|nr:uncharacterized protein UV8b_02794 [Ustilaginoidea virens]QUC18553.1 hypothetical protein UV8b_02794 [Ustilaginoidea virens]
MQQIGYYCGGRGGLQAKLVVPLHTQAFVSNRTPQDAWHWKPTRRQYPLEKLTCLLFETASVEQKDSMMPWGIVGWLDCYSVRLLLWTELVQGVKLRRITKGRLARGDVTFEVFLWVREATKSRRASLGLVRHRMRRHVPSNRESQQQTWLPAYQGMLLVPTGMPDVQASPKSVRQLC